MNRLTPSPDDTDKRLGLDVNGIMWTDATVNPGLYGCAKISAACLNCYAEDMAARIVRMGGKPTGPNARYAEGLVNGRWTGRVSVHPDRVPIEFRKIPWTLGKVRRVFVTSMSDLFHDDVPFGFIDAVFAEMGARPQVFQVLTKRAERMAEYAAHRARCAVEFPLRQWDDDSQVAGPLRRLHAAAAGTEADLAACGARLRYLFPGEAANEAAPSATPTCPACRAAITVWPANVWAGVTVEDQRRADERIPHLLQVPAAVRFLSVEPMLGSVDLRRVRQVVDDFGRDDTCTIDALTGAFSWKDPTESGVGRALSWVIVGSESDGPRPGARETDPAWVLDLVDQCDAASVPVFVKQLSIGGRLCSLPLVDGRVRAGFPHA